MGRCGLSRRCRGFRGRQVRNVCVCVRKKGLGSTAPRWTLSEAPRLREILPTGYNWAMTKSEIGLILADARRRSGKTQAQLADAMGTTQPAIARAEGGYRMPTIGFIDRWSRSTGVPISLALGQSRPRLQSAAERRAMVQSVLGPGRFNPWDRNPAPVEAELLESAGLSRKHFERLRRRRGQGQKARP